MQHKEKCFLLNINTDKGKNLTSPNLTSNIDKLGTRLDKCVLLNTKTDNVTNLM